MSQKKACFGEKYAHQLLKLERKYHYPQSELCNTRYEIHSKSNKKKNKMQQFGNVLRDKYLNILKHILWIIKKNDVLSIINIVIFGEKLGSILV